MLNFIFKAQPSAGRNLTGRKRKASSSPPKEDISEVKPDASNVGVDTRPFDLLPASRDNFRMLLHILDVVSTSSQLDKEFYGFSIAMECVTNYRGHNPFATVDEWMAAVGRLQWREESLLHQKPLVTGEDVQVLFKCQKDQEERPSEGMTSRTGPLASDLTGVMPHVPTSPTPMPAVSPKPSPCVSPEASQSSFQSLGPDPSGNSIASKERATLMRPRASPARKHYPRAAASPPLPSPERKKAGLVIIQERQPGFGSFIGATSTSPPAEFQTPISSVNPKESPKAETPNTGSTKRTGGKLSIIREHGAFLTPIDLINDDPSEDEGPTGAGASPQLGAKFRREMIEAARAEDDGLRNKRRRA